MVSENVKLELRFWSQLAIILFITFAMSNFFGLLKGGFANSDILNQQTFYAIMIIEPIILIAGHFYEMYLKKKSSKYGISIGFSSQGESPHISFFKRFTAPQLFMLSLIFVVILSVVNLSLPYQQKAYTGVNYLTTQQFSPTDSVLYNALLVPGAENLGAAALGVIFIIILGTWARKKDINPDTYKILLAIVFILGFAAFGVGNHKLRYGGSDIALQNVAIFWGMVGLLTVMTGSFLPGWVLHIGNNVPLDLLRFMSADVLKLYLFFFALVLIVLYSFIYRGRLTGSKRVVATEEPVPKVK